ncbi:MAG: hypothetical protein LAO31_03920 [Acidobacteriia bacterium]|nr:hypothetical protein [Terriglobia bacterium]
MDLAKLLPILTGSIAVLSAAVGIAIYVTKLRCEISQSRLENELKNLQEQHSDLETKHRALLSAGSIVFTQKSEIDTQLATIADAIEATGSSILVPSPSITRAGEPKELVFLSLKGQGSENLKRLRVSLDSVAGSVFKSAKAIITHDPRGEGGFATKADQVSKADTLEMLAVPLIYHGRCLGVAEFLNKRGNKQFDLGDQQAAERLIASLVLKVGNFLEDPDNFRLLGITPRRDAEDAAVLFSDVSGSSEMAKHLDASVVIDLMNEYFELLGDVVLRHGGTIDKFLGDGLMVTFNVPKPVVEPGQKAVSAALEMQKSFDGLKSKWSILKIPRLFNRIGIALGPVHRAEMGHSQYRHITVMGEVVNTASNLCELGSREKNIILVGEEIYQTLASDLMVEEFRPKVATRTKGGLSHAYEVKSLR